MISVQLRGTKKDINIDGKASRRSYDTAKKVSMIHTVSAWCREAGIVLGQVKTDEKSNEITAVPELLRKLDINNATITTDALNCQTEIAKLIVERGGDYLLAVKDNQPSLCHDIETAFKYNDTCKALVEQGQAPPLKVPSIGSHHYVDKGHGRLEERTVEVCRDLDWLVDHIPKWSSLAYFVRVTRMQTKILTGKISVEVSYYIGSHSDIKPEAVAKSIRGHWSIETSLHWVLDMAFREDDARHRAGNTAENMAILRHFALNLIKRDKTRTLGVANTRKLAGWDHKVLIKILIDSEEEI
jgi:predicted transposase YbfD/YdcC